MTLSRKRSHSETADTGREESTSKSPNQEPDPSPLPTPPQSSTNDLTFKASRHNFPTSADVQLLREKMPDTYGLTDEQIRAAMMRRKIQQDESAQEQLLNHFMQNADGEESRVSPVDDDEVVIVSTGYRKSGDKALEHQSNDNQLTQTFRRPIEQPGETAAKQRTVSGSPAPANIDPAAASSPSPQQRSGLEGLGISRRGATYVRAPSQRGRRRPRAPILPHIHPKLSSAKPVDTYTAALRTSTGFGRAGTQPTQSASTGVGVPATNVGRALIAATGQPTSTQPEPQQKPVASAPSSQRPAGQAISAINSAKSKSPPSAAPNLNAATVYAAVLTYYRHGVAEPETAVLGAYCSFARAREAVRAALQLPQFVGRKTTMSYNLFQFPGRLEVKGDEVLSNGPMSDAKQVVKAVVSETRIWG